MINNEFDESKHPRDEKGQFAKKEKNALSIIKQNNDELEKIQKELDNFYKKLLATDDIQEGDKILEEMNKLNTRQKKLSDEIIEQYAKMYKAENSYISKKQRIELGKNY